MGVAVATGLLDKFGLVRLAESVSDNLHVLLGLDLVVFGDGARTHVLALDGAVGDGDLCLALVAPDVAFLSDAHT